MPTEWRQWLDRMTTEWSHWLDAHEPAIWWLTILSVLTFLGTLVAVPLIIVRLPADYLAERRGATWPWAELHPAVWMVLLIGKNVLGLLLVLAGVVLLVLPGQGLLTIVVGLSLADFPGKRALERRLIQQPQVLKSVNWIRAKAGKPPLET